MDTHVLFQKFTMHKTTITNLTIIFILSSVLWNMIYKAISSVKHFKTPRTLMLGFAVIKKWFNYFNFNDKMFNELTFCDCSHV